MNVTVFYDCGKVTTFEDSRKLVFVATDDRGASLLNEMSEDPVDGRVVVNLRHVNQVVFEREHVKRGG